MRTGEVGRKHSKNDRGSWSRKWSEFARDKKEKIKIAIARTPRGQRGGGSKNHWG